MRKTREILRQKWVLKRTHRGVATSLGVSAGAVGSAIARATALKLDWAAIEALTDEQLEIKLYGASATSDARPLPNFGYIHAERKKVGVTLELLHLEYLEQHPDGYRYTQFCEHYRAWLAKRKLSMRQEHRAGDKCFIDYSGKRPHIINPENGERIDVELFVAVLGASNYTYAEATLTQQGPDWIASHTRALDFFGGVPAALVPDQLKSGVTTACRYEPGVQRTYEEMAAHYGTSVLPARPASPRDKAKVEVAVQIAQRWILARLRNQIFFTLDALNERIAELVEDLNRRMMRVYGATRLELFERVDRPALGPLPTTRFIYGSWKKARVNIDYHIEIDRHYYSVPHALVREEVEARITGGLSRSSTVASASPRTCAATSVALTLPIPSTCPCCTRSTSSGRRRESCTGLARSASQRRRSSRRFCASACIPSTAIARASGSCGSPSATAMRGSRPHALARCVSVRGRTGTSIRS
jgi:transposase